MNSPLHEMQRHPGRWLILVVLCLSTLVLVIDGSVLNVAIPPLTRDLGASAQDIQWIMDAYMLTFAGLLLLAGSLSDRYGRRKVMIIGLLVFGVASLVATLATSPGQLIAARALMGAGAALSMPSTLSILITVFDDAERRRAMSVWSAATMIGTVGGPVLGGLLIAQFWWGSVFLLNVPITAIAIIAALVLMPESKGPWRKGDPLGAVLSMVGMAALVWAIISLPTGGLSNPTTLALFAVAVVGLAGFGIWETRTASPMVPLSLFRDRNFSGASFSLVLLTVANSGLLLAMTQYLQFVLGYTPAQAGLVVVPMALAMLVVNGLGIGLGHKVGNRPMLTIGLTLMAAGIGLMATVSAQGNVVTLVTALVLMGVGGGVGMPAGVAALMGAVPPEHAAVGTALNDTVQQMGAALGVAVLGSILAGVYTSAMPTSAPAQARRSIGDALGVAARTADPGLAETAKTAFTSAMSVSFVVGACGALAGALLAVATVRDRKAAPAVAEPTPQDVPIP